MELCGYPSVVIRLPFVATKSSLEAYKANACEPHGLRIAVQRSTQAGALWPRPPFLILEGVDGTKYAVSGYHNTTVLCDGYITRVLYKARGGEDEDETVGIASKESDALKNVMEACGGSGTKTLPCVQPGSVVDVSVHEPSIAVRVDAECTWPVCDRTLLGDLAIPLPTDASRVESEVFIIRVAFHLRLYVSCEDSRLADLNCSANAGADAFSATSTQSAAYCTSLAKIVAYARASHVLGGPEQAGAGDGSVVSTGRPRTVAAHGVVAQARQVQQELKDLAKRGSSVSEAEVQRLIKRLTQCSGSESSMIELIDSLIPVPVPAEGLHPAVTGLRLSAKDDSGHKLGLKLYQQQAVHYMLQREGILDKGVSVCLDHPWEAPVKAGTLDVEAYQPPARFAHTGKKSNGYVAQSAKLPVDRSWLHRFLLEVRSRTIPMLEECGPVARVCVTGGDGQPQAQAQGSSTSSAASSPLASSSNAITFAAAFRLQYALPYVRRQVTNKTPGVFAGYDSDGEERHTEATTRVVATVFEEIASLVEYYLQRREDRPISSSKPSDLVVPFLARSAPRLSSDFSGSYSFSPHGQEATLCYGTVETTLPALTILGPVASSASSSACDGSNTSGLLSSSFAGAAGTGSSSHKRLRRQSGQPLVTASSQEPEKMAPAGLQDMVLPEESGPARKLARLVRSVHDSDEDEGEGEGEDEEGHTAPGLGVGLSLRLGSRNHATGGQQAVGPPPPFSSPAASAPAVPNLDDDDDIVWIPDSPVAPDVEDAVIDLCDEDDTVQLQAQQQQQQQQQHAPQKAGSPPVPVTMAAVPAAFSPEALLRSGKLPGQEQQAMPDRLVISPGAGAAAVDEGMDDRSGDASTLSGPSEDVSLLSGSGAGLHGSSGERQRKLHPSMLMQMREQAWQADVAASVRALRLGYTVSAATAPVRVPRPAQVADSAQGAGAQFFSWAWKAPSTKAVDKAVDIFMMRPTAALPYGLLAPSSSSASTATDVQDVLSLMSHEAYPVLTAPLPAVAEAKMTRARDHPLWERVELTIDAPMPPSARFSTSSSASSSAGSSSQPLPVLYPCCSYYIKDGVVVRDRCSTCLTRPVPALPAARQQPSSPLPSSSAGVDGVMRSGILSDEVGLGKTLECIALVAANPHSSQPFYVGKQPTGTQALGAHMNATPFYDIRAFLRENARLTTQASLAYRASYAAAHGSLSSTQIPLLAQYMCADPYRQLSASEDSSWVGSRATLVIGTSIAGQWVSEIRKWAPQLAVVLYPGQEQAKRAYFCRHADSWVYWPSPVSGAALKGKSSSNAPGAGSVACQSCLTDNFHPDTARMPAGGSADVMAATATFDSSSSSAAGAGGSSSISAGSMLKVGESAGHSYPSGVTDYAIMCRDRLLAAMATADIVVCTWDQLELELKEYKSGTGLLRKVFWHRVILDEVQVLEQSVSAVTKDRQALQRHTVDSLNKRIMVAKQLQGANRWAVSSTPLSSAEGLQDILEFLRHKLFEDKNVWTHQVMPVLTALKPMEDSAALVTALGERLSSHMLAHNVCPLSPGVSVSSPECANGCYYCKQNESTELGAALERPVLRVHFRSDQEVDQVLELAHRLLKSLRTCAPAADGDSDQYADQRRKTDRMRQKFGLTGLVAAASYPPMLETYMTYCRVRRQGVRAVVLNAAKMYAAVLKAFRPVRLPGLNAALEEELILAQARLRSFVEAAEKSHLVNRMGCGMQMVRSILQPMLWRNKKSIVQAAGQLEEVKVQDVAVLIELSQAERHVHNTLLTRYQDGVISQLKAWVAANKGRQANERLLFQAARAAEESRLLVHTNIQSENFSGNGDLHSMCSIAEQGIRDLQAACAHLEASHMLAQRLGMADLQGKPLTLRSIMESMVVGAQEELQKAALAVVDASTKALATAIAAVSEILSLHAWLSDYCMGPGHDLTEHAVLGNLRDPDVVVRDRLLEHNQESAPEDRYSWHLIQVARLVCRTPCEACFPVHPGTGQRLPRPSGDKRVHALECGSLADFNIEDLLTSALKCAEAVPAACHLASSVLGFSLLASPSAVLNPSAATSNGGAGSGAAGSGSGSGAGGSKFMQFLTIHTAGAAGESVTKDDWAEVQLVAQPGAGSGSGTHAGADGSDDGFVAKQVQRHTDAARSWKSSLWKVWRMYSASARLLAASTAGGKRRMDWKAMQEVVGGREIHAARTAVGASVVAPGSEDGLKLLRNASADVQRLALNVHSYDQLLPKIGSKVRFRCAALDSTEELQMLWEARKAGRALTYAEEDALACIVCSEDLQEGDVVLFPCCHRVCQRCFYRLVLQDKLTAQQQDTLPIAELKRMAAPDMAGKCPTCREAVRPRDVHKIEKAATAPASAGSTATGVVVQDAPSQAREISISTVSALTATISSSSSGLFPGTVTTAQANAVQLSIDARGQAGPGASSAAVAQAARADASVAYGGKIACLIRRIRALPPADKCVVATSYDQLTRLTAQALQSEGIRAAILSGVPTEKTRLLEEFAGRGSSSGTSSSSSSSSSAASGPLRVLVLSTSQDSAGMNLTCANHLFIMDPVLDEGVIAQLRGRIDRQGQSKACTVYHMAVAGTVEERIIKHREGRKAAALADAASASSSSGAGAGAGGAGAGSSSAGVSSKAGVHAALTPTELLFLLDGPQQQPA